MARVLFFGLAMVLVSLSETASAQQKMVPSLSFPIEHRTGVRAAVAAVQPTNDQEQEEVSLDDYDLQVVPNDQVALADYGITDISILDIIWELLPSPIAIFKKICEKIWKIIKFTIPIDLVLLGMALVVGFCAFTPYCTLIIEKPLALKLRSIGDSVPYLDEVHSFFNDAYYKLHDMQF